ncbi:MAG: M20/M25/M40 family metallo-hydrolase, partial [Gammaproteobacteria bacterium]|nr:M20/M25/M40 family metallo-hydrolase [Gammaproteobacteria bacterium]
IKAAEKFTGKTSGSVAFGTEAPYLTQLGIETLILGPGNIDQAHQPDEYLDLNQVQPTIDLLRQFILQFCIH